VRFHRATEVTNAQYAEFLNFKAASDPLSLYNTNMGSNGSRSPTMPRSTASSRCNWRPPIALP
jgi:hypothetical protein